MHTVETSELMDPTKNVLEAPYSGEKADSGVLAFPASIAQQTFWYLALLESGVTAFNVPLRFKFDGPLNIGFLERALNLIVARHESLRTYFGEDNGELLQIVLPELVLTIPLIDISHLPADRIQDEADRLGSVEAHRPFDLAKAPLIRTELLKLGEESYIFHLSVHHALFDGWSMGIFTHELAAAYQAYSDGLECTLEPLALQYGDFSVWQKEFLESPEMQRQLEFWKRKLAGMTELELPTDFPRPAVKSWSGDIVSTLIDLELTDKLQQVATKHQASLFHLQMAVYMILLHRYCGTTDVAVGTPVTGRTHGELEPIIGVFINSLILRGDLSGNPRFGDFLSQVRETTFEALENQEVPFECLVRELRPERDPSRNPLFQVNFNHHKSFIPTGSCGDVQFTSIPSRSPGTIFDLHFFMVERNEGWRLSCDFCTDLFTRSSALRMLGHFKRLLTDIAEHPERPIDQLSILTARETEKLREWSGVKSDYPREVTIGGLFLETAERFANRTALVYGNEEIRYNQLAIEAKIIAGELADAGVRRGERVAICAKQGPEMIAGFLGILLAGACCVPLDASYPPERFAMLLNECGARIALLGEGCGTADFAKWSGRTMDLAPFGTRSETETLPKCAAAAEDPAFLLFTSGSTGRPKGVLLSHRGNVRLVRGNHFISISEDDVFLQAAPSSFDASLLEIWGALLNGGRLVLLPNGPSLENIASAVRDHGVTTLWLTSGLFQLMIDEQASALTGLKYLLAGGDVLSPSHVRRALDVLPDTTLINGYGPTENTTFTTCHIIRREDLEKPSIPIGRPIANSSVHILDSLQRPVPVGIPGELHAGGDGLAIGYLNSPELTAEKFIEHPEFGRLYRTGDLCRFREDGIIEFLGRRDHQVKVRGFRIELGEIESVLAEHPLVKQAKAAVRGSDSETKRILAWVVPCDGTHPASAELNAHLSSRLPTFMRPDAITVLDALPLNANGKVDVALLPDSGQQSPTQGDTPFEPPQGNHETKLAALWQELLAIEKVGRNDDFFSLGGHSLMALRMFSRINQEFGKSLPLAILIQHPTIAKLAPLVAPAQPIAEPTQRVEAPAPPVEAPVPRPLPGQNKTTSKGNIVTLSQGSGRNHIFCIHGGDGGVIFYRNLAGRMPRDYSFHAIESLELGNSGAVERASIEETASAYLGNILEIQKEGPFKLAGYSFGGVVAHEIACQLLDLGHQVEFLGMFDTHNPNAPSRRYRIGERLSVFWQQSSGASLPERLGLLKSRIVEGAQTHRRVKAELKAATTNGPADAYSDLRRVQVREQNWRAMLAYNPRPFKGRITLFKTTHVDDKVEHPADYGWSGVAQSGLDIVSVSGHHLALFAPEYAETLSDAFLGSLKRASQRHPNHTPTSSGAP